MQQKRRWGSHSLPSLRSGAFYRERVFDQAQAIPLEPYIYPPGRGRRPGRGGWPPIDGRMGIEVEAMMNTDAYPLHGDIAKSEL